MHKRPVTTNFDRRLVATVSWKSAIILHFIIVDDLFPLCGNRCQQQFGSEILHPFYNLPTTIWQLPLDRQLITDKAAPDQCLIGDWSTTEVASQFHECTDRPGIDGLHCRPQCVVLSSRHCIILSPAFKLITYYSAQRKSFI